MRTNALWLAALLLAPGVASAEVVYGGSSTVAEVLRGGAATGFQAKGRAKLRIADAAGTGQGLRALAEGKIDLAGSGRVLDAAEKRSGLLGTVIGYDGLALYVHRSNPVTDLSRQQLKAIFTGKVRNWKEVGGRDVAIVPLVEPLASTRATVQLVRELVLEGAAFMPGIRELDQLKDQVSEVARSEGAVCFASVGFLASAGGDVRGALRQVSIDATAPSDSNIRSGAYLLSRPMLLVTRGRPSGEVKAFVEYMLSDEGQAIVERYFVAVKKGP
jgi:phosphate transport system substrate-binding protein